MSAEIALINQAILDQGAGDPKKKTKLKRAGWENLTVEYDEPSPKHLARLNFFTSHLPKSPVLATEKVSHIFLSSLLFEQT